MAQPASALRHPRYVQVVDYCRATFDAHGYTPSYSMIRDEFGFYGSGDVRRYVKQAEAAGLITLADYRGGRGPRRGQRIRFGTPAEADAGRKMIRLGSELD